MTFTTVALLIFAILLALTFAVTRLYESCPVVDYDDSSLDEIDIQAILDRALYFREEQAKLVNLLAKHHNVSLDDHISMLELSDVVLFGANYTKASKAIGDQLARDEKISFQGR